MDLHLLQEHLNEVQSHLDNSKRRLTTSENRYQASLNLITDPALRSLLMEQHLILSNRQREVIDSMRVMQTCLEGMIKKLIV